MRFYFHLHNDIEARDEEGRELPDLQTALNSAREEARVIAANSVRLGHLNLSHSIEVADEAGRSLFKVRFGDVITVTA